jgi:uncharacterized protein YcbK (DUF882 family)
MPFTLQCTIVLSADWCGNDSEKFRTGQFKLQMALRDSQGHYVAVFMVVGTLDSESINAMTKNKTNGVTSQDYKLNRAKRWHQTNTAD